MLENLRLGCPPWKIAVGAKLRQLDIPNWIGPSDSKSDDEIGQWLQSDFKSDDEIRFQLNEDDVFNQH